MSRLSKSKKWKIPALCMICHKRKVEKIGMYTMLLCKICGKDINDKYSSVS